jgi:alpha-tubulin suppressor-like RCC1 family protein
MDLPRANQVNQRWHTIASDRSLKPGFVNMIGLFHQCLLTSDGRVFSRGRNDCGQLGNETTERNIWSPVTGELTNKTVTAIRLGDYFTVALTKDGEVYSWGSNSKGQLGDASEEKTRFTPTLVKALLGKKVIAIAAGIDFAVALTDEGEVYAWGNNDVGQLGTGTTEKVKNTPTLVGGELQRNRVKQIKAGESHVVVLLEDGKVLSWGGNRQGQLGNGREINSHTPTSVEGILKSKKVIDIFAGAVYSVAITDEDEVFSWGHVDNDCKSIPSVKPTLQDKKATAIRTERTFFDIRLEDGQVLRQGRVGRDDLFESHSIGSLKAPQRYNYEICTLF